MFDPGKSCLGLALVLAGGPCLAAAPSAQSILAEADAIRNPAEPFQVAITLVEYRDKREQDRSRIQVYAKWNPARQQFDNLVRFMEPARDRSKLLLKNGNEIWFFDRSSQSGVRLSAQQRMLGQAANGDVVTVNFAKDYQPSLEAEEKVLDGDRKERTCLKLKLTATSADVMYHAVDYWVEKGTCHPVKGKFYSDSGRLLKTAFYRKFETQLGRPRPMETIIIDGMDPQWVTLMQCSGYRSRTLPDAWMRRDGLPSFRD